MIIYHARYFILFTYYYSISYFQVCRMNIIALPFAILLWWFNQFITVPYHSFIHTTDTRIFILFHYYHYILFHKIDIIQLQFALNMTEAAKTSLCCTHECKLVHCFFWGEFYLLLGKNIGSLNTRKKITFSKKCIVSYRYARFSFINDKDSLLKQSKI